MASLEKYEQKREKNYYSYGDKLEGFEAKQNDYSIKITGYTAQLDKLSRSDRKLDEKKVTLYNFKIDDTGVHREARTISKREYVEDYKPNNRGLLHKIESNLKIDVNVIPDQYVKTKKVAHFVGNVANTIALKNEDFLMGLGKGTAQVAGNLIVQKAQSTAYEQGQSNTGLRGALIVGGGAVRATSWIVRHNQQMKPYKKQELTRRRDKLIAKTEKIELKKEIAKEKFIFKDRKLTAKESGNSLKLSKKEKKSSWKEISLPENPNANLMKAAGAKGYLKKSRPERRMYNAEKKLYKKRTVKKAYFNEATGKTVFKKETFYDKSTPKEFKVKKPQNAVKALAGAGIGAAANKYFNQLAQSDNYGAEAMGKVARTTFSQISRIQRSASSQRKQKMKFEKSKKRAQLKYNKADAKLQVHNLKQAEKAKQTPKKSKKAAKKKRNARLFQKRQAQMAKKKAANAAANKAANAISFKNKLIIDLLTKVK